jgi:hypothetical protein
MSSHPGCLTKQSREEHWAFGSSTPWTEVKDRGAGGGTAAVVGRYQLYSPLPGSVLRQVMLPAASFCLSSLPTTLFIYTLPQWIKFVIFSKVPWKGKESQNLQPVLNRWKGEEASHQGLLWWRKREVEKMSGFTVNAFVCESLVFPSYLGELLPSPWIWLLTWVTPRKLVSAE